MIPINTRAGWEFRPKWRGWDEWGRGLLEDCFLSGEERARSVMAKRSMRWSLEAVAFGAGLGRGTPVGGGDAADALRYPLGPKGWEIVVRKLRGW
jgi:hypothetical protein